MKFNLTLCLDPITTTEEMETTLESSTTTLSSSRLLRASTSHSSLAEVLTSLAETTKPTTVITTGSYACCSKNEGHTKWWDAVPILFELCRYSDILRSICLILC